MPFIPRLVLCLSLLLTLSLKAQETVRFRQWLGGVETGGMEAHSSMDGPRRRLDLRDWMQLKRLGLVVEQEVKQTLWRTPSGSIKAQWELRLSQEPMQGEAEWSPTRPSELKLTPRGMPSRTLPLPEGTLLWPEDADARMMVAAAQRSPLKVTVYAIPMQQTSTLDLACLGPAPLPGFPEAVRFKGRSQEGPMTSEVEVWISPTRGELRHQGKVMGMDYLLQRSELPDPGSQASSQGFFEQTLRPLPPHPLRLWMREMTVTWTGEQPPLLPSDPQQTQLSPLRYRLRQAEEPSPAEARELPVSGKPLPVDAPYLASTPLARLEDPVFDGLISRLKAPQGASRWELARLVTAFVFAWIEDKDYSVGFASAQEVARNGRGDCTEHGALAIALLRRLGVPCRAVTGWAALGDTLGLHFWVEVKLGKRWVPIDPTFDQAPASALRIKLSVSDLSDIGSLGWDGAAADLKQGDWRLDPPWPQGIQSEGSLLRITGDRSISAMGHRWRLSNTALCLSGTPLIQVEASISPSRAQTRGARYLMGSSGTKGWWTSATRQLWMEAAPGAWLHLGPVDEAQALSLLDSISLHNAMKPPKP